MSEWLDRLSSNGVDLSPLDPSLTVLLSRLVLAWLCGIGVAWIARRNRPRAEPDTLPVTLILMSILIAMATQIIGDNIARAFSLVGALSIVRFRTAVRETRDVAFVLAAVVVGMAVGAGQYWVSGLGIVVVGLATFLARGGQNPIEALEGSSDPTNPSWRVTLQVGLSQVGGWESEFQKFCDDHRLVSAETTRRGSSLSFVYRVSPSPDSKQVDLIAALHAVPAVESVHAKVL
ncbi:MAG: DUF4956 domain-containing protein [Planctomycetota bacterium]